MLLEVGEHALVALLVQGRHLLGALGRVDLAALVTAALEQLDQQLLQVLVLARQLAVEVVEQGRVAPPLPHRPAGRDGLRQSAEGGGVPVLEEVDEVDEAVEEVEAAG